LRDAPAFREVYYTILHGDLSSLAGYGWIPDEIKGDREALLSFMTARSNITIEAGREIADLVKSNLETYGFSNWYNWCVAKWGTKWDIDGSGGRSGPDHASYNFDSVWGPPIEGFIEVSKNFPGLTFDLEYRSDPVRAFCGRVEIRNGEVIGECQDNFHDADDVRGLIDSGAYDFVAGELECWLEMISEDEGGDE
jgi:hypothetical protein